MSLVTLNKICDLLSSTSSPSLFTITLFSLVYNDARARVREKKRSRKVVISPKMPKYSFGKHDIIQTQKILSKTRLHYIHLKNKVTHLFVYEVYRTSDVDVNKVNVSDVCQQLRGLHHNLGVAATDLKLLCKLN